MPAAFEYRQAEEIRDVFARHGVRYLFIGKSGAILLGFPDTTQDADLFADKSPENCSALGIALRDLGFALTDEQASEILRGKDFVQLKNGPFDLDLVFAPDGIESFADAWKRRVNVERFPVCTPTTSSQARWQRTGPRTASRCRACALSATTGRAATDLRPLRPAPIPQPPSGFHLFSGVSARQQSTIAIAALQSLPWPTSVTPSMKRWSTLPNRV
jgi:hypothetical protein